MPKLAPPRNQHAVSDSSTKGKIVLLALTWLVLLAIGVGIWRWIIVPKKNQQQEQATKQQADQTLAAMVLMRALFDRVLIETVGVGQSETDVAGVADTVVFCVQPGSGDSLQFMKAGIVEIPHLVVVTKADMGAAAARQAIAALSHALLDSFTAASIAGPAILS